jgi:dTDP-4-dehydrorhamnose reductase
MSRTKILVTGANGQLASELRLLESAYPGFHFMFQSKQDLPINDYERMLRFFKTNHPAFCINCAAYTAVDRAEAEKEQAYLVNAEAVGKLAEICRGEQCKFLHISTDYVFDGKSSVPYTENDPVDPVNVYGASKLEGERLAMKLNKESVIIRSSWLYSSLGNNFVKTMIGLMQKKAEINVVYDQTGSPTYAADLAGAIMHIIEFKEWIPGIYHYSNAGNTSWYGFATAIRDLIGSNCKINAIPGSQYPTAAKRPSYSLLDTGLIKVRFGLSIPNWEKSLERCLKKIMGPKG